MSRWRRYFYCLCGALGLACQALYAVALSHGVRFLLRNRVSWRFTPVVERYGANVDAYAVSSADIPVNGNVGSVDSKLVGCFYGSPDFVSVVFSSNFSFGLKIRVYRQKLHQPIFGRR